MNYKEKLQVFDKLLLKAGFTRKGKTMPYTSHNGHMFTLFNKAGEMGIRFSKERQKEYFDRFNTSYFISYGAKMQGYVLITDMMISDEELVCSLIKESYNYIKTLEAK